ncbi:MAG: hypothetical protein WD928_15480 [Gammaproteobacteria bacterium]
MSDEFGPLARAEAEVLGMNALPLTAIPHPLAGNEAELVRAKAAAIAMEIAAALTDSPDVLAERHASRFLALTERRLSGGAVCVDEVCAFDPAIVRPSSDREETA